MGKDNTKKIHLTLKEKEILIWSARGLTKTDIGCHLNISTHTVDYHVRNAIKKLGAKNITSAVVVALKTDLIDI